MSEGTAGTPAIYAAILAVMADVRGIGKDGQMPKEAKVGEYKYRRAEDVEDAVSVAFRRHHVMIQATDMRTTYTENVTQGRNGSTLWTSCRLKVTYMFTSLVDGSFVQFEGAGEGRDSSDKATSKAMTSALKYAITQAFAVSYHHADPEAERPTVFQEDQYKPAPPPAPDTRAPEQRAAEQAYQARRVAAEANGGPVQAQTAPTDPEPDGDPLGKAERMLADQLGAEPVDAAGKALIIAHREYSAAMVNGRQPYPRDDAHAQRAAKAAYALRNAQNRITVDAIILKAQQEALLVLTVDGQPLAALAAAQRATFPAVTK